MPCQIFRTHQATSSGLPYLWAVEVRCSSFLAQWSRPIIEFNYSTDVVMKFEKMLLTTVSTTSLPLGQHSAHFLLLCSITEKNSICQPNSAPKGVRWHDVLFHLTCALNRTLRVLYRHLSIADCGEPQNSPPWLDVLAQPSILFIANYFAFGRSSLVMPPPS